MVSEMTFGYGLLVPLMLATAVAYLLTPQRMSIYEEQVHSRIDSPAHADEFAQDVLGGIKVKDVLRAEAALCVFHPVTPMDDILRAAANSRQQVFPVVDAAENFLGLIDFQDIRAFLSQYAPPAPLLLAQDLLMSDVPTLRLDDDLASALRKLQLTKLAELPVLAEDSRRVVAILGRRDIIAAYHQEMYALPAVTLPLQKK
jgi:CIC family chloride channel protein